RQAVLQFVSSDLAYAGFLEKAIPIRWSIDFLIMTGISLVSISISIFSRQVEEQQRVMHTSTMIKEAELQKLQNQLQPHFLFNSLNSINAMILTKPSEARTMVEQLSDFLRTTTKRAD